MGVQLFPLISNLNLPGTPRYSSLDADSLLVSSQDMLTMLGDQGPNYNNEEFPELNIFPSFSE